MAKEFWRTIRLAIEKDNWTARLLVVLLAAGVAGPGAWLIMAGR
ncbi:hypothetical protein [Streptomyces sp. NPDC005009]